MSDDALMAVIRQLMTPRALPPLPPRPSLPTRRAYQPPRGIIDPGNVDLLGQPIVPNDDGTTSTVDSLSVNLDGEEVLLPTVTPDGRHLRTVDEAIAEYMRTGRHLGKFTRPEHADSFAAQLHEEYEGGKYSKGRR